MAEAVARLFRDFPVGVDVLLAGFGGGWVFVGQQQVELDLRVIYGVRPDYLVEVVPLAHDFLVLGQVRGHRPLEKRPEGLYQFAFPHYYF